MSPKVFLRLKRTDLFYARVGAWSPDPERAVDFKDSVAACKFAKQEGLNDVEIIIRTEDKESCIPIE